MQDQIGTLSDAAASTIDKEAALAELQVLVEPIDNANGEGVHCSMAADTGFYADTADFLYKHSSRPCICIMPPACKPSDREHAPVAVRSTASSHNATIPSLPLTRACKPVQTKALSPAPVQTCAQYCADLKVLGGLEPLVSLLADGAGPSLQAGAAYVLGTAVSNNEKLAAVLVQEHPALLQQLLTVGGRTRVCVAAAACGRAANLLWLLLTLQPATPCTKFVRPCSTSLHLFAA